VYRTGAAVHRTPPDFSEALAHMGVELDLNCDMGESFGAWTMGNDAAILESVTSANIACGFHAGDPSTMRETVALAIARGVAIGAHPGLPDLAGFGRRAMAVKPREVYDMVVYQIGAIAAFARAAGGRVSHYKAHGALSNMAAKDRALAEAITQAARDIDPTMMSYAIAESELVRAAERLGVPVASEVFADRSYQDDAMLTPRAQPGAMIDDIEASVAQVKGMVLRGEVTAVSGRVVRVRADTLCVHGDQPGALAFVQRIRAELEREGITIRAPGPR
jgi:UPF0271 protein